MAENTCVITGSVISGRGVGVPGLLVFARPYQIGMIHNTLGALVSQDVQSSVTDSQGTYSLELLRNCEYIVSIPVIGFREKVMVPDQETADIRELISAPITGKSPTGGNTNW